MMNFLKIPGKPSVGLSKSYFTVGGGHSFDASVPLNTDRMLFTIHSDKGRMFVIPGSEKVALNGKTLQATSEVQVCDRISWKTGSAVILDSVEDTVTQSPAQKVLTLLKELSPKLERVESIQDALDMAIEAIAEVSQAEVAYVIAESETTAEWRLIASHGKGAQMSSDKRNEMISSTILNEAVESREPVYLESIIGHPLAQQASIMDAQVFSLACLPLIAGDKVFGCIYLYTRTPGQTIQKEGLDEINLIATQIMLLLVSRRQLVRKSEENRRLKKLVLPKTTELIFNESSPMAKVYERLLKLSVSDLNLLVLGETGVGKELVAREIHQNSERRKGPFIAVNCGAIPPSLIESVLFGYSKGAFTGANKNTKGKFELASGGTLFLDEIGDLPSDLQVKLLRVIQEKTVEPLGSDKSLAVDVRLVTATHRNLESLVQKGEFREDLFYRINGAVLAVPPLRERLIDLSELSSFFLSQAERSLTDRALKKLESHSWAGNVRELQQTLLRAAALTESKRIDADDLELTVSMASSSGFTDLQWDNLKEAQVAFTQRFVQKALDKFDGNRTLAATHLGVSERTLYRILSTDTNDSLI